MSPALPNVASGLPPDAVQKGSRPSPATHAFSFFRVFFAALFWEAKVLEYRHRTLGVTSVALATVLDGQRGNLDGDQAEQVATKRAQWLALADFLIGLFEVIPLKGARDPLDGGVSPKRVSARRWLAEGFGLARSPLLVLQRQKAQAKRRGANSFLASIRGW